MQKRSAFGLAAENRALSLLRIQNFNRSADGVCRGYAVRRSADRLADARYRDGDTGEVALDQRSVDDGDVFVFVRISEEYLSCFCNCFFA